MSFDTKHSTPEQNNSFAPDGAPTTPGSNEPTGAGAQVPQEEPQELVLLSQTKNTVETVYREAREETIINGQYIMDGEDDTYYYCYYQRVYRTKVMKDAAKAKINYRDEKGRLLPGYSLVTKTKDLTGTAVVKSKTRKRYTKKTAEKYLENDLIADLIEDIQTAELSDKDRVNAKLALVNYVKPTLSKVQTEKVIKVVGDDFEDAEVVEETPGNDQA